jgi:hypothetical protein
VLGDVYKTQDPARRPPRRRRPAGHLLAAMDHATRAVLATCSVSRPTSPPCWPAALACPGTMSPWGPHPRPRPRRAAYPQGRHRAPLRPPAHRPGPPGHPQDPRPARRQHPAVADRGRLRDPQPRLRPASPARLADLLRGHWAIENGLHEVRDVTFAEDASQTVHRDRPAGHGLPAQPDHRRAQPRRAGPPRRRPFASTPATPPPWPPSESPSDEPNPTQGRRSPGSGCARPTKPWIRAQGLGRRACAMRVT